jgi:hypothetical protein
MQPLARSSSLTPGQAEGRETMKAEAQGDYQTKELTFLNKTWLCGCGTLNSTESIICGTCKKARNTLS